MATLHLQVVIFHLQVVILHLQEASLLQQEVCHLLLELFNILWEASHLLQEDSLLLREAFHLLQEVSLLLWEASRLLRRISILQQEAILKIQGAILHIQEAILQLEVTRHLWEGSPLHQEATLLLEDSLHILDAVLHLQPSPTPSPICPLTLVQEGWGWGLEYWAQHWHPVSWEGRLGLEVGSAKWLHPHWDLVDMDLEDWEDTVLGEWDQWVVLELWWVWEEGDTLWEEDPRGEWIRKP